MFEKTQHFLLTRYPLLWNTKAVPMAVLLVVMNLLFLVIGFASGGIDFEHKFDQFYGNDSEAGLIFFSILASILLLIVWLVYYFKNNAFKRFYPKNNFSLFKEWLILLGISLFLCTFISMYYLGKDIRKRSYFTEDEARRRCEILSLGSYFVDGSFSNNYIDSYNYEEAVADASGKNDSILFKGKRYSYFSLLNKNLNTYEFFDHEADSLHKLKLRTWLVTQQKDSLQKLFTEYLKIAEEHKLKANITAEQWLTLINDYPDFINFRLIGKSDLGESIYPEKYKETPFDSINKFNKLEGSEFFEYYKNYVPEEKLSDSYSEVADAWESPNFNWYTLLIPLYFGIGLSLLIFSFRVTSGKNWLIALVSVGILNMLVGIFTLVTGEEITYPVVILLVIVGLIFYFMAKTAQKEDKGISGIVINILVWSLPAFIPLIYLTVSMYYNKYFHTDVYNNKQYQTAVAIEEFLPYMFYINLFFVVFVMLLLSIKLKKWRGLAES